MRFFQLLGISFAGTSSSDGGSEPPSNDGAYFAPSYFGGRYFGRRYFG